MSASTSNQKIFRSAGGVVIGSKGQVVVVNQDGSTWSLPKGHVDPGESDQQTAEREIREESGITDLTLIKELGSYERYRMGPGGVGEDKRHLKRITLFLFSTKQRNFTPQDASNPEARWVPPRDVATLLTHPKDKAFFEKVLPEVLASVESAS